MDVECVTFVARELELKRPKIAKLLGYDDFYQEVHLACVKAHQKFDEKILPSSPLAFYRTVARNHIYNLFRGILYSNNGTSRKLMRQKQKIIWPKHLTPEMEPYDIDHRYFAIDLKDEIEHG